MARPRSIFSRYSTREWGVRAALAIIAAALGVFAVSISLANVIAPASPALAHMLSPTDGQITARLAENEFALSPVPDSKSRAARLADLALRQDATAVDALSVLGLQAQMRREPMKAQRLFAYSLELSRRDLRARIWAIEEAVQRGDINAALKNYDIALSTSHDAVDTLFPVLSTALKEPKVRASLIDLMKSNPVWEEDFINFVSRSARDPADTVLFFHDGEARGVKFPIDDGDRVSIVNAFAKAGRYEDAWNYYASFRRGADRLSSRDPDFSGPPSDAAVFDWQLADEAGAYAALQKGAKGGMLDFRVPPGTGGILLRQLELLPPGTYRLTGSTTGIDQPKSTALYWMVTCLDGRELGRVALPTSSENSGKFGGTVIVPASCPVQSLLLITPPSDGIDGVSGQIETAQLRLADQAAKRS